MTDKAIDQTPGTLNLTIMAATILGICGTLWAASHTQSWVVFIGAALIFSFLGNTMYALMHEAVHRHFHDNRTINENAGRIIAGFFPTAFALQRVFHLSHHKNSRTERERFDYYAPGEKRFVKFVQWYCILTGLYWILLPLFSVIYFFTADLIKGRRLFGKSGEWFAKQTSAQEFLDSLDAVPVWRARLDIMIGLSVQLALIFLLDLSLAGWAVCYAAFAVNWSSLQYTDHAFSDLDNREGAWNLKVNGLVRMVFLNYHHHLVHHRDPSIPWVALPKHVQATDPSPSFWSIYFKMWGGPRPLPVTDDAVNPAE
ncbi:fatty acid desaturase family protein [Parasulfitobacter algicola]|uniref:Fatty acid desaturase n=1 Tax=Parasulfitobacter algicola TaxID=2614809 RepID=A0ABX2IN51_9RHOB|nr:fatty acid desaturase [Sulfitobacter algicola]NSX53780.1 fatty acid desaturase [Sulfitobacter algicola]